MAKTIISSKAIVALSCLFAACASSKGQEPAAATAGASSGGNVNPDSGAGSGNSGDPGSAGQIGNTSNGGNTASGGNSSGGSAALPPIVPPRAPAGSCGLEKPAFCETFDTPSPGGKGGDIDESVWAFSRWGHETRQHFVRIPAATETDRTVTSTFCGKPFSNLLLPNDVASCDGIGVDGLTSRQLNEVYDDQGDFAFNSMRIRQLFDFTNRTGTIVFDVDAKINPFNIGHGWWVEVWITEDPAPMPYHEAPGVVPYPRNGLGINLQGLNSCPQGREATEVSRVFVTKEYKILHDYPGFELKHDSDEARCFTTKDQKLNRIKVMVSKDQLEVWATNFDDPKPHRIASAPILDLPFTRGYVHLQHSAYNARKDGNVTGVQTYRWDNVGFDGPSYAVPKVSEADDNTLPDIDGVKGHMYGYQLTDKSFTKLKLKDLDITDATSATFAFNFLADSDRSLLYRFNGGPTHQFKVPKFDREGLRSFSTDQPVAELVSGENTLEVMMSSGQTNAEEYVGNLEVSVQGPQ